MCRGVAGGGWGASLFQEAVAKGKEEVMWDETDCRNTADIEGTGALFGGELVLKVGD